MYRTADLGCLVPTGSELRDLRVKFILFFAAVVTRMVPGRGACDCFEQCSSGTLRHLIHVDEFRGSCFDADSSESLA